MTKTIVHRCRRYKFNPGSIQSIELRAEENKLVIACIKNSSKFKTPKSSVQIWKRTGDVVFPYQEIPTGKNTLAETLAWVDDRLFCGTLNGEVIEYNLLNGKPKYTVDTGFGIFCMAYSKQANLLAVGSVKGQVRLLSVEGRLRIEKELKVAGDEPGDVMSLAWHCNGNVLVTGEATGKIRIWSIKESNVTMTISLSRLHRKDPARVFALCILRDFTIVCGDSYGQVQFFDGKYTTLIKCFSPITKNTKGSVLTLTCSKDHTRIFASGMDPCIQQFKKSNDDKEWTRTRMLHKKHTHDVRSVAFMNDYVVSGGVDSNLIISDTKSNFKQRMLPFSSKQMASSSISKGLMLMQYDYHLELWSMAINEPIKKLSSEEVRKVFIQEEERLINKTKVPEDEEEQITCSQISECGNFIAYSTTEKCRIFSIDYEHTPISFTKEQIHGEDLQGCNHMNFSDDGKLFWQVTYDRSFNVFSIDPENNYATLICHLEKIDLKTCVNVMQVSLDSKYVAVADLSGDIFIYKMQQNENNQWILDFDFSLPAYKDNVATALRFYQDSQKNTMLVVAYSDFQVREFCINTQSFTQWSRDFNTTNQKSDAGSLAPLKKKKKQKSKYPAMAGVVSSIHVKKVGKDRFTFIFTSHNGLYIVEKGRNEKKNSKQTAPDRFWKGFQPLLHVNVNGDEMLAIEKPLNDIEKELAPIYKKKFAE